MSGHLLQFLFFTIIFYLCQLLTKANEEFFVPACPKQINRANEEKNR
jgi:hypothetical protein